MLTLYIDTPDTFFLSICNKAFPNYRGKKLQLRIVESGTNLTLNSYWSGGSKETHVILRLADLQSIAVPENGGHPNQSKPINNFMLSSGFVVVTHTIFSGKDLGLTVTGLSSDLATSLPKPNAELTREEKVCLYYTRSLISSARREYAARKGVNEKQWEAAKQSLIEKGLLNKAGAITPEGKNVAQAIDQGEL